MSRRFLRVSALGLILPALLSAFIAAPVSAAGTTRYVDDDGTVSATSCDGTNTSPATIQAAINGANAGDVVMVCPGEYAGRITINKRITLRGVTPWTATITAAVGHDITKPLVWIKNTTAAKVFWLNILAPADGDCEQLYYGVKIDHAPYTSFRSNKLGLDGTLGLECGYAMGIYVLNGSRKSDVAWNTLTDFDFTGIGVSNSKRVNVYGNTLNWFHAGYEPDFEDQPTAGIQVDGSSAHTKIGRNLVRSLDSAGVTTPRLDDAIRVHVDDAIVVRNTIRYVDTGIVLFDARPVVHSNTISETKNFGFNVSGATNGLIRDNSATGIGGIFVSDSSTGNTVRDNYFEGEGISCWDASTGGGTSGTANTWINNIGTDNIPADICEPESSDT